MGWKPVRGDQLMSGPGTPPGDPIDGLSAADRHRILLRNLDEGPARYPVATGALLFGIGFLLLAIIGTVAWFTVPIMLARGDDVGGTSFTGGPGARLVILAIYALVAAIGLTVMVGGSYMAATGKRSPHLIRIMFGCIALILLLGGVIRFL